MVMVFHRPRAGYNPYEGLPSTLDPGMLEKLYSLPEDPEYVPLILALSWVYTIPFLSSICGDIQHRTLLYCFPGA